MGLIKATEALARVHTGLNLLNYPVNTVLPGLGKISKIPTPVSSSLTTACLPLPSSHITDNPNDSLEVVHQVLIILTLPQMT